LFFVRWCRREFALQCLLPSLQGCYIDESERKLDVSDPQITSVIRPENVCAKTLAIRFCPDCCGTALAV
jgi:hypothetical protein